MQSLEWRKLNGEKCMQSAARTFKRARLLGCGNERFHRFPDEKTQSIQSTHSITFSGPHRNVLRRCAGVHKRCISGAKKTQKCALMMHIRGELHGMENACN